MAFLNVAVLFMSEVRVFGPINMFCYLPKGDNSSRAVVANKGADTCRALKIRPGTAEGMASLHKLFFYSYHEENALDTHFFSPSLTYNFC